MWGVGTPRRAQRLVGRAGLQGAPLMVPYFHLNTSKTQEDLEVQVTLVENLRRYVGEQVPPEVHSQTWESERQELLETMQVRKCRVHVWGVGVGREAGILGEGWPLGRAASPEGANRPLSCWQHLQEDRAGLHTTAGLLEVRVQSLTHILSLQEQELARKVGRASLCGRGRGGGGLSFPELAAAPAAWAALRETEVAASFLCSPRSPHCPPPLPRRFRLQIPWSLSSPGSASPCCSAGGRRCLP